MLMIYHFARSQKKATLTFMRTSSDPIAEEGEARKTAA
jgi:hypothetical protein